MIRKIFRIAREMKDARELSALRVHTDPDDLPSQTLKVARYRSVGAQIGGRCRFLGNIDTLNPHLIEIGRCCVIGAESMLLAHGPGFSGAKTIVGDYTYIGYRVTVLPGVEIGPGCIIGACSVVTRSIPPGKVVAGNPARIMRDVRSEEAADIRYRLDNNLFFGKDGKVA